MSDKLEKKVFWWVAADANGLAGASAEDYCATRNIFQARLDKMTNDLLSAGKISEADDNR